MLEMNKYYSLIVGRKIFDSNKQNSQNNFKPFYDEYMDHFKDISKGIIPELFVVSTFNKQIEFKNSIKDDKSYIIFDDHLLEIMGELISIYYNGNCKDIEKITYKLISEEYYCSNELHKALYYAYKYKSCLYGQYCENDKVLKTLLLHKTFVLIHESTHWFLFSNDINIKNEHVLDKRELWLKILSNLFDITGNENTRELLNSMKKNIEKDDEIVMECVCDFIATTFIFENLDEEYSMDKVNLAVMCFLCIQNMQLISFIKTYTTAKNIEEAQNKLHYKITLRMVIFKYTIENYFRISYPSSEKEFHKGIMESKEKYSNKILHNFFKTINNEMEKINTLELLAEVETFTNEWEVLNKLVYDLLHE